MFYCILIILFFYHSYLVNSNKTPNAAELRNEGDKAILDGKYTVAEKYYQEACEVEDTNAYNFYKYAVGSICIQFINLNYLNIPLIFFIYPLNILPIFLIIFIFIK